MRKITVNSDAAIRALTPFAYKDVIKTLENSNEARVSLDGKRVFRSAVTSGVDVKARTGKKFHLYFYATEADAKAGPERREFLPITAEEFAAYRSDPAFSFDLRTVAAEAPAAEAPAPAAPAPKAKRVKRETAAA